MCGQKIKEEEEVEENQYKRNRVPAPSVPGSLKTMRSKGLPAECRARSTEHGAYFSQI